MNGSQEVSFFWLYIHFPTDDYFWESKNYAANNNNNVFSLASRTRLRSCLETVAARHTIF